MKKNTIVKFKEEDHSYWGGKKKFISVNGLLDHFGFEFDMDYWLPRKALEKHIPNYYKLYFAKGFNFEERNPPTEKLIKAFEPVLDKLGLCIGEITADVRDDWIMSGIKGTAFHNEREDEAYDLGYIINPFDGKKYTTRQKPPISKDYDNLSTLDFLKNLEDGAYTELLVFSVLHFLAGQVDEVFIETVKGIRYIDIGDHKTNNKKPTLSKKNGTCLYPIEHLYDCKFVKYQLQLSMYAKLLEMLGYKVRNLGIYHYKDYDVSTKKIITFKYLSKECDDILDTYLDHLNS